MRRVYVQVYLRSYNGGEEFIIEHRRVSRTGERWVRLSAGSLIQGQENSSFLPVHAPLREVDRRELGHAHQTLTHSCAVL